MADDTHAPRVTSDLMRYLRVLADRVWWVVASVVIGAVLFVPWAARQIPIYQATATIMVDAQGAQVLGSDVHDVVQVGPGQAYLMQDYIQTQRRVLTSDTLALDTVRALKLMHPDTLEAVWGPQPPVNERAAAERLAGWISADPVIDTYLINVAVTHPNAAQAKRLVDGLVDTYRTSNSKARDLTTSEASTFLQAQSDELRQKLHLSEMALYIFKRDNDLLSVALEDRINSVTRRVDKLTDALTDVRLRKVARTAEAEELAKMMSADTIVPTASATGDALSALKKDLADDERKLGELRARYEDAHPLVRQQQAKVASLQSTMRREAATQLRSSQARANEAAAEERKIAVQLDEAKHDGLRVTRLEVEYNNLKRDADSLGKQYALVLNRTKETELSAKVRANNLHVLDYARLPGVPVSPRLVRSGVLALLLALLVGLGVALLIDALDRSLKTQADVEERMGLPFLGMVPHVSELRSDLIVAEEPQSPTAESCRLIRTSLQFTGMNRPLQRILVTSAMPKEGKTLTSISLAVVMAQAGQRVLLIDADLRRPRLANAFRLDSRVGLTSVLLGAVTIDAAVQETSVPNLFVLAAGPVPPNPAELLQGPRFAEVLESCSSKWERVIVDSPPAVPVADPSILASLCDGVVLVARAHKTSFDQAERARRNLVDTGARILGVVLNDVDLHRSGYAAYRYGYDSGSGSRGVGRLRG